MGAKPSEATADTPLESTALLVAGAAVKVDAKATPAVPKPMSAVGSLAPGLRRKKVLLPDAMVREVPSNVATRPAACKAGLAGNPALMACARSLPERELSPTASPAARSMGAMAMEGPPLMENSRCVKPHETVLSYAAPLMAV